MPALLDHPTVRRHASAPHRERPSQLSSVRLRELSLACGADNCGFVEVERPSIAVDRADIERALPGAKSLIAFARRMNREDVRTPARSVANLEFHMRAWFNSRGFHQIALSRPACHSA